MKKIAYSTGTDTFFAPALRKTTSFWLALALLQCGDEVIRRLVERLVNTIMCRYRHNKSLLSDSILYIPFPASCDEGENSKPPNSMQNASAARRP